MSAWLMTDRISSHCLDMKNGAWVPHFLRTEVSGRAEVAGSVSMAVDVTQEGRCLPLERNEVWFQIVLVFLRDLIIAAFL